MVKPTWRCPCRRRPARWRTPAPTRLHDARAVQQHMCEPSGCPVSVASPPRGPSPPHVPAAVKRRPSHALGRRCMSGARLELASPPRGPSPPHVPQAGRTKSKRKANEKQTKGKSKANEKQTKSKRKANERQTKSTAAYIAYQLACLPLELTVVYVQEVQLGVEARALLHIPVRQFNYRGGAFSFISCEWRRATRFSLRRRAPCRGPALAKKTRPLTRKPSYPQTPRRCTAVQKGCTSTAWCCWCE